MAFSLPLRRVSVLAMLLACVGPVSASWYEVQLTPDNAKSNGLAFKVEARDMGDSKEIEVVVMAETGRALSPFLSAILEVRAGKRLLLSCPVEKKEQDGALRYRFSISATDVDKVRFRFEEYGFTTRADKDGSVKTVPMPSVADYWLDLEDFVAGKAEPLVSPHHTGTLVVGLLVLGIALYVAMRRSKRRKTATQIQT